MDGNKQGRGINTNMISTLTSDVEALLSFQLPFATSLFSDPALLPTLLPLATLTLPVLRYMLPSLLPTA